MHHILGVLLRDNENEILDDETPGKTAYSLMGLQAAIFEGQNRMHQNPNIKRINIYEVFDGVRRMTADGGRYMLVYKLE
jgi:hypothetical protein